jgi:hypothetical protein
MPDQFHVSAGRFEMWDGLWERNCKFADSFNTFDEALEAYDKCSSYPWREMKYKDRIIEVM